MPKKATKKKPAPKTFGPANNPRIVVKAFPVGKGAKKITTDAVFISTFTERDEDDVIVTMCGFSSAFGPSDAFEMRFLNDVLNDWQDANGRGWNFVLLDTRGEFYSHVGKEKSKR